MVGGVLVGIYGNAQEFVVFVGVVAVVLLYDGSELVVLVFVGV